MAKKNRHRTYARLRSFNSSAPEEGDDDEQEQEQEACIEEGDEESDSMEIFIKIPHIGKTITLDVEAPDTLRTIRALIAGREGIPRAHQ